MAMQPEERLDALVSHRQQSGANRSPDSAQAGPSSDQPEAGPPDVGALLGAADHVAVWGTADPSPTFADRLEAALLARFAAQPDMLRSSGTSFAEEPDETQPSTLVKTSGEHADQLPMRRDASISRNGQGVAAHERRDSLPSGGVSSHLLPGHQIQPGHHLQRRAVRLLWPAVAAAVFLLVGTAAIAAVAMDARPGQLLYGVHRLEQTITTDLTTSPAERVRLHLSYAQQALEAFLTDVAQHASERADQEALMAFEQEEQAAQTGLAGLPASAAREALVAQLAALRQRGQADLYGTLPALDWPMRADVTVALGQLGARVPHLGQASLTGVTQNGTYIWLVTVTGSGFASKAVVLIDGQPMGTVVVQSPTRLVAQIPGAQLQAGSYSVGVGNPDDTATLVTGVQSGGVPDDHGGSGGHDGGGSGSNGGSGSSSGSSGSSGGTGSSGGSSGGGSGSGGSGGSGNSGTPTPTADGH
jgi:hypothetical protein